MSSTLKIRRKTNPIFEAIQFTGKNSKEVAAFAKGVLTENQDAVVKAGGSYVKITWPNGTETVVRKNFWVVDGEGGLVEIYTENDFSELFKTVK